MNEAVKCFLSTIMTDAVKNGYIHVLTLLREHPSVDTSVMVNILQTAIKLDQQEVIGWVMNDEHVDATNCMLGVLHSATKDGDLYVVKAVIKYFADMHIGIDYCDKILTPAAKHGHLPIIQYLCEQSNNGINNDVLRCAAVNGHLPVVQYM